MFVIFMLGAKCLLWPLDPGKEINQYNQKIYSTEEGLPQSSILSIIQTKDGYLWMGTYEGAARFDGIQFRIFNKSNTPEMESNRIKTLFEDSMGNLWIGTSKGLLRYSQGKFKKYTTEHGLSNDFVLSITEDQSGSIWVGTTHGLNRLKEKTFTISVYTEKQGLSHNYISALVVDDEGSLWIGTSGGGLNVYRNGELKQCSKEIGLPGNEDIRVLYKRRTGGIWVGTSGNGLIYIKNGKSRVYSKKEGLSGHDIRALFEDSHGILWVGTNGQGLNRFKNGSFSFSASDHGLLNRPIRAILEDREGSLWIGTRDGLSQLNDGKFIIYNKRNGLPEDSVRTVYEDRKKNTWIGTVNGGLVRFRDNNFKTFGLKEGLLSEHIWTIAEKGDGSTWFGTYGGGLHCLKNSKIIRTYTTRNGLSNNIVRAVFVDHSDNIWVGTNGGGVDVLKNGKFINYNSKTGLSDDFVYAISEDSEGDIWIGTYNGNINRFNKGKFTVYGVNDGLTGHAIWTIYPDDERTLWIGTDGGGLLRFKNNKFMRFTMKDGLYNDLAFQVLEDHSGNLWMNCNQGIYRVRKKDLDDFAKGKIKRIPCLSFGKSEGIKSTECSGPAQPAGLCSSEGKLWFPTIRGVVVFDPEHIKINKTVPPVVIEEMQVDGETVYTYPGTPGETINLGAGKHRIEFKYTGLSFTISERMRFKYKLEGYDERWMDANTKRSVSYTNIAPGDYTFRVIACNSDGIWNNKGALFSFALEPLFWQTWWFRILFIIAFAFFSYWIINFIKKHLKLIAFWKKKKYIGSYEIEEQIGIGGMGIVHRVHSLMDKSKIYALKVLKDEYLLDEVQRKRFKNESMMVDRIDHPNIVKVYERGEDNGRLYIVMELLEGRTLAERIKNNEYPTISQCLHILAQVADVLSDLARENIIHRDLKLENIILIREEEDPDFVKLLDFGIARIQTFSHLTESGTILGTLPYMPPEVVSDRALSPAVDVYSLGIIAYKLLTRVGPFEGDKPLYTMKQIINKIPPAPFELNPEISPQLNHLILKMIEKRPELRPTAQQVIEELRKLKY